LCCGTKAEEMEGRTPAGIEIIRPLRASVIVDYRAAAQLLNHVINQSVLKGLLFHPRLIMSVPVGISKVHERSLLEAAVAVGVRKTVLIKQPVATLMGAKINTNRIHGALVVDVGGGSAKISALSRRAVVASAFTGDSGTAMDQAIVNKVLEKYHVRIGRKAAETLKITLGASWDLDQAARSCEVCGLSAVSGLPVKVSVTSEIVARALNPILYRIFKAVNSVIEKTSPSVLFDIRGRGILMVGGVSEMKGFRELMERATGIPAEVAKQPRYLNALGVGNALEYMDYFRDSLQDLH